jgi:hypothetical protein
MTIGRSKVWLQGWESAEHPAQIASAVDKANDGECPRAKSVGNQIWANGPEPIARILYFFASVANRWHSCQQRKRVFHPLKEMIGRDHVVRGDVFPRLAISRRASAAKTARLMRVSRDESWISCARHPVFAVLRRRRLQQLFPRSECFAPLRRATHPVPQARNRRSVPAVRARPDWP